MKAELYKRLFRAIFSEDIPSLKKNCRNDYSRRTKIGT